MAGGTGRQYSNSNRLAARQGSRGSAGKGWLTGGQGQNQGGHPGKEDDS